MGRNFSIEEHDDSFIIHGVDYGTIRKGPKGTKTVQWMKELASSGNRFSLADWLNGNFSLPTTRDVHATLRSLYLNRSGKQKNLVDEVVSMLSDDFERKGGLSTRTRVRYNLRRDEHYDNIILDPQDENSAIINLDLICPTLGEGTSKSPDVIENLLGRNKNFSVRYYLQEVTNIYSWASGSYPRTIRGMTWHPLALGTSFRNYEGSGNFYIDCTVDLEKTKQTVREMRVLGK